MQKKHEDRLLFLREFTKELILQSKSPETTEQEPEKTEYKIIVPSKQKGEKPKLTIKRPVIIPRYRLRPVAIPQIHAPKQKPKIQLNPPLTEQEEPAKIEKEQTQKPEQIEFRLEKLDFLIQNPDINLIECPGPEKLILINKGEKTETTNISLTQKEIQNIIQEFSEKAKIPVTGGLFKAEISNLSIIAVVSDLIGSRFIIIKTIPHPY